VGAAALPAGAGQRGADRRDQAGVGIGDDQLDPGQAASDQPAQQRQPAGAILAGGDVEAEDLPVPVGVDPVAMSACTFTTRASSRTLTLSASTQQKVYGPVSSGRSRNAVTWTSRWAAISLT
jgi:hypothetical protein